LAISLSYTTPSSRCPKGGGGTHPRVGPLTSSTALAHTGGSQVGSADFVDSDTYTHSPRNAHRRSVYGDEKVANREIRVWHGATENGP
jgi:hypothetical protein